MGDEYSLIPAAVGATNGNITVLGDRRQLLTGGLLSWRSGTNNARNFKVIT